MFRKNTAGQTLGFTALYVTTGVTMSGVTGFAAYLVIDGGAQALATGTVTDKGNGQYSFALSQADTNGNDISILFTMPGMVAVEKTFVTTACDPTSVAFGLLLAKTTNITGFNDIAATAIVTAGAINTSGGKVSEVALVDTLTTYTGNTPQTGDSYARIGANGASLTSLALASNGLDSITIESGVNARQSLSAILAVCGGIVSGAGTGTVVIKGGNVSTTRITATTDSNGNRSAVTLSLPT